MIKLYHGTSFEFYEKIMAEGFNADKTTWSVSWHQDTYFWNPEQLLESGEAETLEEAQARAIQMAFESAQITASVHSSIAKKIVVIEYLFDDSEGKPEPDLSCENMAYGACEVDRANKNNISGIYTADYNPFLSVFTVASVLSQDLLNTCVIDESLLSAAEAIKDKGIFLEELLEFNMSDFQPKEEPTK
jgi:hypothetical protein